MAQDFAKKRAAPEARRRTGRAATRNEEERKSAHWGWYFSGLFSGFLIIGIGYLGIIQLDTRSGTQSPDTALVEGDAAGNRPTFDFGFYGELENAEIAVSTPAAERAAGNSGAIEGRSEAGREQTTTPQELTRYLIQAGSFQNRQDAENRRAKIILLNMSASIVPGVVTGRTVHRVQVGPFNSRAAVESALDLLSENNIDTYLLEARDSPQD